MILRKGGSSAYRKKIEVTALGVFPTSLWEDTMVPWGKKSISQRSLAELRFIFCSLISQAAHAFSARNTRNCRWNGRVFVCAMLRFLVRRRMARLRKKARTATQGFFSSEFLQTCSFLD